jgi:hypothetical protein
MTSTCSKCATKVFLFCAAHMMPRGSAIIFGYLIGKPDVRRVGVNDEFDLLPCTMPLLI